MAKINTVITREGDTVAAIAYAFYGDTQGGKVEKILAANPAVCAYPLRLPAGLQLTIPAIEARAAQIIKTVNLWD